MCVYCMVADWGKEWVVPQQPVWPNPMLTQFEDLLRRVKELEDRLGGCPCPDKSKVEFINEMRKKLDELEKGDT